MNWELQYSANAKLSSPLIGLCVLKFPTEDGVHYLVKEVNGITSPMVTASFVIKPIGATFVSAGGKVPKVRLYLQRQGDDMSAKGNMQYYRWWSNPAAVELESGVWHLSAPLKPDQWQDVLGKMGTTNPDMFHQAVTNASYLGMTFGDDTGFGHGVWSKKDGFKFKLLTFSP